jgi:hypothetical protein
MKKVVPVLDLVKHHAMNTCVAVEIGPPRNQLQKTLAGSGSPSGRFGGENSLALPGIGARAVVS